MTVTDAKPDNERAVVRCDTTKGPVVMEFHRDWSPIGYDRAIDLFEKGFYESSHFFRVVPNFLVQFGITYNKKLTYQPAILDDPQKVPPIPFELGTISYAGSGINSRTSQMFISYGSSKTLGKQSWETPVGSVIEGIENVQAFYSYGDMPPWGLGPVQGQIHSGREYIDQQFPLTDSFKICQVERVNLNVIDSLKNVEQSSSDVNSKAELFSKTFSSSKHNSLKKSHHDIRLYLVQVGGLLLVFAFVFKLLRQFGNGYSRKRS